MLLGIAMSYDVTIRSDDAYSRYAAVKSLGEFIASLPHMSRGSAFGFTLDDQESRYMEIDLEVVDEFGDNIEERGKEYAEINRVALHIPYQVLGEAPERDYFPIAFSIARYLGWQVFDEQQGEYLENWS
jgi:hypothetical protein